MSKQFVIVGIPALFIISIVGYCANYVKTAICPPPIDMNFNNSQYTNVPVFVV
jgi:hypothetical protein